MNVVMVGPELSAASGISAVVNHWLDAGLAERVALRYIPTLDERDARVPLRKLYSACRAYATFVLHSFARPVDVVHIHVSTGTSFYRKLLIFRLARLRALKTVVHLHGSRFEQFYSEGGAVQARLIRSLFDGADAVIVLSKSWEEYIRKVTTNRNIHILHNGARTGMFGPREDNGSEIVIASMGILGRRKGTYDLIDAFHRLSAHVPEARLVLGGDGETDKAKALVERLGLADKVTIPGWVSGKSKLAIFNRADIYALPSYNEGLPGSILEAMAAGAPVVSTPVGGIPEAVVDGDNGFLIQPGDVAALHDRLADLCRDSSLRARMGRRGKQLIDEKFNVHELVSELVDVYWKTSTPHGLERTQT